MKKISNLKVNIPIFKQKTRGPGVLSSLIADGVKDFLQPAKISNQMIDFLKDQKILVEKSLETHTH